MLLFTPKGNLDFFMSEFNKQLAQKIQNETGECNQIFDGHYKWCLIQSQQYLSNCYRYVYQNPVRAGVVRRCEDYKFSTLQSTIGHSIFTIPVHDQFGFKDEYGLYWLNEKLQDDSVFTLKKNLAESISVKM
jgi:putative transposase